MSCFYLHSMLNCMRDPFTHSLHWLVNRYKGTISYSVILYLSGRCGGCLQVRWDRLRQVPFSCIFQWNCLFFLAVVMKSFLLWSVFVFFQYWSLPFHYFFLKFIIIIENSRNIYFFKAEKMYKKFILFIVCPENLFSVTQTCFHGIELSIDDFQQ